MKTTQELEQFIDIDFRNWLSSLTPESVALWGKMDAQQMVEHLIIAVNVSNGKQLITLATPIEKVEKVKKIALLSDRPLQREFKNVALPTDPIPHEYADLQAAKQGLIEAVQAFKNHFETEAEKTQLHNIFGELNYQEWMWFHYKHFIHHFSQFGIIPTVDRIS
jgi:oxepin-CoA hydrolase/3-oxo-5,6-dehydrosuberyl-CoA semialdehyde dehydrogenase